MSVLNFRVNVTSNGQTDTRNVPSTGAHVLFATGDFGDGQITFEASPDNGATWFTIERMRTSGRVIRHLATGEIFRARLENATAPNITLGVLS